VRLWPASAKRASRKSRLSRFARAVHSRSQLKNALRFYDGQNKNMNTEQTKLTRQERDAVLRALTAKYKTLSSEHKACDDSTWKTVLSRQLAAAWKAYESVSILDVAD
jgi:hypothetical protein